MCSVKVHWVVGFKEKEWLSEETFQNNIHIQTYNWTKYALCESTVSYGLQVEAIALRENFQNIIHIETYNWRKYVLCESTLSGGLQAEVMAFRRNFSKQYTHSNIQLNKVCALWKYSELWASSRSNGFRRKFSKHYTHWNIQLKKVCALWKYIDWWASRRRNGFQKKLFENYTHSNMHSNKVCALWKYSEWWASRRRNGFQKNFFETLYTFKHEIEQSMHSVKVHWVVGFKQKQWVSEEVFQNILHIQTYNWTMYALCESILSGWLQAEAMPRRRIFLKHYTHSNIQFKKVSALWNFSEWWTSSRSNGFQNKIFETLYTFKHTIELSMRSVKVQWVMGFK